MADSKLTQLDPVTQLGSGDQFYVVQSGVSKRVEYTLLGKHICNIAECVVDFGNSLNDLAQVTISGQQWVTPSSLIAAYLSNNPAPSGDVIEGMIEQIHVVVNGVDTGRFTVNAHAPNMTTGKYKIIIIGK